MTTLQRRAAKTAQIVLVAAVVWYALYQAQRDWDKVTAAANQLRPNWGLIVLSAAIVVAAYLLLIQAWRRLMRDWGTDIPHVASMRIWFVSVLGRYIPGRIWSAASVALMAKQAGFSPLIAIVGSCRAAQLIAAWSSRVWLTVLEILPGVILTLFATAAASPRTTGEAAGSPSKQQP